MIRLQGSVCVEASVETVWAVLSDIENVPLWVEPIVDAYCSSDTKRGIGTERTCRLKGNMTIKEKWILWEEGKSFAYIGYGLPLMKSAKNTWTLKNENGKTLLSSEAEIEFKGGILGKLLELVMRPMMRRLGAPTLAAFKYFVENGRPFEGKHSSLPSAAVTC